MVILGTVFLKSEKDSPPEPEVVLSLDISGSCVGWAIGVDRHLVKYGKYVFKSTMSQGEKILAFSELLTNLFTYEPNVVILEKPLNRAKSKKHHEFLGVLRLRWQQYSGNSDIPEDNLLDPRTIKKQLHVEPGKSHKENKNRMVEKINLLHGLKLKFHPTSKSPNLNDDDIADAIAVLDVYWKLYGN